MGLTMGARQPSASARGRRAPLWLPSRSVQFLAKIQEKNWCDHEFWFVWVFLLRNAKAKGVACGDLEVLGRRALGVGAAARCNFQRKIFVQFFKKLHWCNFWRKLCFVFGVITNFSFVLDDSTEECEGNPKGARRPTALSRGAHGVGANLDVVLRWQQPTAVPELHFGTACPERAVEQPAEIPTYLVSNRLVIRIRNWARMQIIVASTHVAHQ